ncbi:MAG: hypothetical protein ACLTLQ_12420 [[Clostridium] scindens]
MSPAIQEDIDTFLKEKQYELKNEVAVKSDYYRNSNMWNILSVARSSEQDTPSDRPDAVCSHTGRG